MTRPNNYRPEIDGLRGLAVTAVMVYHAWPHMFPGGFAGVDIFFVISGYLITSIIWRELEDGSFTLMRFYERRVRRIFPALFTMIALILIVSFWFMSPGMLEDLSQSVLATTLFLSNFYFDAKVGYFEPRAEYMPLLHTWSLAIEEQYYVIFPIILMIVARWRAQNLPIFLWALLFLSMMQVFVFSDIDKRSDDFFYLPSRAWELLSGALLAIHSKRVEFVLASRSGLRFVLELLGLAGIILGFVLLDSDAIIPGPLMLPVVGGTVLLIATMGPRTPVTRIFGSRLAVGLGLVSYSAYLWHQPLFAIGRVTLGPLSATVMPVIFIMTFMVAYLSWRIVERPFRSQHFGTQKQVLLGAFCTILLFSFLGVAGHLSKGFPKRFSKEQQALASTMNISPHRNSCHREGMDYARLEHTCVYVDGEKIDGDISNATPTWAVMGDSHGVEFSLALSQSDLFKGIGVAHFTFSGCPPLLQYDYDNPGCLSWTRETLDFLIDHPTIMDVALIYRHGFYLYGNQLDSYPSPIATAPRFLNDSPASHAINAYWMEYEKIVSTLVNAGKTVHLIQPIPELPKMMEQLIFSRLEAETVFGAPSEFYIERHPQNLASFAGSGRKIVPVFDILCPSGFCLAESDGHALYFDDNHMSLSGFAWLLKSLQNQGYLVP